MADYLIWWTNQSDCERIEHLGLAGQLGHWPEYIFEEFGSRNGRNGRGRLWVSLKLRPTPPEEADWDDEAAVCKMAADAGGIVIVDSDANEVRHLPGFVTTFEMKIWRPR